MKKPDNTYGGLPRSVKDLLSSCPIAGDGVNNWLFRCARVLHTFRASAEIEILLAAGAATCGRAVNPTEIARAIDNSQRYAFQLGANGKNRCASQKSKWVKPNIEQIEAILTNGATPVDLWEHSSVRTEDNLCHTEEIIDGLFPGNPLLCVGKNNAKFDTRTREKWRGTLAEVALIVPSPMSARTGLTQEGKVSAHALNNTGPRRFLVIECDFSIYARDRKNETPFASLIRKLAGAGLDTLDMGAAILWHLAQRAPLVLAAHSGGKSLHGWFYCAGQSEERLEKFMRYAVSIGADSATWTRSQFVRMPDGTRENGKRQRAYYFNPGVIK